MPFIAADYTTASGKKFANAPATLVDYLKLMSDLSLNCTNKVADTNISYDPYVNWAILFEGSRTKEGITDKKKKLSSLVNFFNLKKDSSVSETRGIHCHTLTNCSSLPWRGQFLVQSNRDDIVTPVSQLKNVKCVANFKLKEGLFVATLTNGNDFCTEVDVFVIPCVSKEQAFYQCFLDELKCLFGIPKLGCHSLLLSETIAKINKKDGWTNQNWAFTKDNSLSGGFVVIFPVKSLGFENVNDAADNFVNCTLLRNL